MLNEPLLLHIYITGITNSNEKRKQHTHSCLYDVILNILLFCCILHGACIFCLCPIILLLQIQTNTHHKHRSAITSDSHHFLPASKCKHPRDELCVHHQACLLPASSTHQAQTLISLKHWISSLLSPISASAVAWSLPSFTSLSLSLHVIPGPVSSMHQCQVPTTTITTGDVPSQGP